jgi:hypothetical protein
MTSGNGVEESGEESPVCDVEPSPEVPTDDSCDGAATTVDAAPAPITDRPPTSRRKPGVEYRPI